MQQGLKRVGSAIAMMLLAVALARADSISLVTSMSGLGGNDSVEWSQLGADATDLPASFGFTSSNGLSGTVSLSGAHSLVSVVCPAGPACSWNLGVGGVGFNADDTLLWTADAGNGGNGPLTLNFSSVSVAGVGALVQADGPSKFTAQIQAFNGGTSLGGPFSVSSDAMGDAVFVGVLDSSGANISRVVFSISACQGNCGDFAIDAVSLKR